MNISKLGQKDKCIFAIKLAERACTYLQESNARGLLNEAMEISRQWVRTEGNAGEVLYDFLDNEENGFTLFQEAEEDEKRIHAWDCIIDAVAYVSRAAYEKEGAKYLPEPIEAVDENIFTHMVQSLSLCGETEYGYIERIYEQCLEEDE